MALVFPIFIAFIDLVELPKFMEVMFFGGVVYALRPIV
jgi:hypothetical protein